MLLVSIALLAVIVGLAARFPDRADGVTLPVGVHAAAIGFGAGLTLLPGVTTPTPCFDTHRTQCRITPVSCG